MARGRTPNPANRADVTRRSPPPSISTELTSRFALNPGAGANLGSPDLSPLHVDPALRSGTTGGVGMMRKRLSVAIHQPLPGVTASAASPNPRDDRDGEAEGESSVKAAGSAPILNKSSTGGRSYRRADAGPHWPSRLLGSVPTFRQSYGLVLILTTALVAFFAISVNQSRPKDPDVFNVHAPILDAAVMAVEHGQAIAHPTVTWEERFSHADSATANGSRTAGTLLTKRLVLLSGVSRAMREACQVLDATCNARTVRGCREPDGKKAAGFKRVCSSALDHIVAAVDAIRDLDARALRTVPTGLLAAVESLQEPWSGLNVSHWQADACADGGPEDGHELGWCSRPLARYRPLDPRAVKVLAATWQAAEAARATGLCGRGQPVEDDGANTRAPDGSGWRGPVPEDGLRGLQAITDDIFSLQDIRVSCERRGVDCRHCDFALTAKCKYDLDRALAVLTKHRDIMGNANWLNDRFCARAGQSASLALRLSESRVDEWYSVHNSDSLAAASGVLPRPETVVEDINQTAAALRMTVAQLGRELDQAEAWIDPIIQHKVEEETRKWATALSKKKYSPL